MRGAIIRKYEEKGASSSLNEEEGNKRYNYENLKGHWLKCPSIVYPGGMRDASYTPVTPLVGAQAGLDAD